MKITISVFIASLFLTNILYSQSSIDSARIITEATNGEFKSTTGDIVVEYCEFENTSYEAKLVDLNSDGNPEVIITLTSG